MADAPKVTIPDSESFESAPEKSSRDPEALRTQMQAWLTTRLGDATDVTVGEITSPGSNGMSSETLLFDASWSDAYGAHN